MFFLLQVLAVLAVVFGVAVVLTGRAGGMSDEPQDLASVGIPRDRAMTPDDVIGLRFALALRGYRMDEVDDALDRLAAEIAARDEAIKRLRAEVEAGQGRTVEPAREDAFVPAGSREDVPEAWAAFAPPRAEEPYEDVEDLEEVEDLEDLEDVEGFEDDVEVEEPAEDVPAAPLAPLASPPPLPETPATTAPAWATARRSADDYIASDATGELPEGTEVDVPTTPEGWQALDPTIPVATDPATPTFAEPPNPFRPEVPDIPAYDPWSVTPRSRYTDGPTYVEVEHDDDSDPVEAIAEHHTGYAPPPPASDEGGDAPADTAADAPTAALTDLEAAAAEAADAASVPDDGSEADEPGDAPGERPWQS